jgi:hypothetical protein
MREIRPRLTDEWFAIIEQVKELGVDQALQRLRSYDDGKLIIDSKDDSVELKTNRVINLEDLLEKANIDLEEWLVERHVLNKWEVGAKDAEGNIVIEPLYQVKAWLKRKGFAEPDESWTQKWLDRLVKHTKPKPPSGVTSGVTSGITNVVISDLHLGRFSEGRLNYEYNT